MNQSWRTMPLIGYLSEIILCQSDSMYITIPKSDLAFPKSSVHAHNGFEFIIPMVDTPHLCMDEKEYTGYKNHISPINPEQGHGFLREMEKIRFIDIFMDQEFMTKIADDVYHKSHLRFQNNNYRISSKMMNMINMFHQESIFDTPGSSLQLQSLSCFIAVLLLQEVNNNLSTEIKAPCMDYHHIKYAIEYIHDNYKSDFSLAELSGIAKMSRYHFIRVFKKNTGKTPYEYMLDIRMERAKNLLAKKTMPITEVCFESGFNSQSHFTNIFKKRTGVTPSLYRLMMFD